MVNVCQEKQEDFRNAIQSLKGWILELFKDGKIDLYDKDLGNYYVKRIAYCSKLDAFIQAEKPPKRKPHVDGNGDEGNSP